MKEVRNKTQFQEVTFHILDWLPQEWVVAYWMEEHWNSLRPIGTSQSMCQTGVWNQELKAIKNQWEDKRNHL